MAPSEGIDAGATVFTFEKGFSKNCFLTHGGSIFQRKKISFFSLIFSPLFESNLCSNWPCFICLLCDKFKAAHKHKWWWSQMCRIFSCVVIILSFFFNYNSLFWAKLVFTLQWYLRRNTFICNNICDNGILVENKTTFLRLDVIACCIINEASLMTFRSYRHD